MADDITVRLRLRAEEFAAESRKAFSKLPDEAQRAGAQAGENLSRGFARAEPVIESYARAQAAATRTVQEARTAYKAGEISLEQYKATQLETRLALTQVKAEHQAVTRELNREAKAALNAKSANDNVTASAGAQRAGMQQLGFQIQDFSVQVAGGTSATRAFGQQLPQAIGAMQLMAGTGGRLASFFAGPWGVALSTAAVVAVGLADSLFEAEEATDDTAEATETLAQQLDLARHSYDEVIKATQDYNEEQERSRESTLAAAQAVAAKTAANIREAISLRQRLKAELELREAQFDAAKSQTFGAAGGAGAGAATAAYSRSVGDVQARLKKNAEDLQTLTTGAWNATRAVGVEMGKIASDPRYAIQERFKAARMEAEATGKSAGEIAKRIAQINREEEAALDGLRDRSGRSGRGRTSRKSDAEREAEKAAREIARERERAAEAAARNEERFAEAVESTLQGQRDAERVERVRAELGEAAAAAEEARLAFVRQHPEAEAKTVEELAKALGIEGEITAEKRKQLQLLIDQADAAEDGQAARARKAVEDREARERAEREKKRIADAIEEEKRQREDAIRDLSGLYEDLFTGNTGNIVRNFKRMFLGAISEIAAQYTLALLSGQSAGNLNQVAGAAFGQSPLFGLFGGRTSFGGAANDNYPGGIFTPGINPDAGVYGGIGGIIPGLGDATKAAGAPSILDSPVFALAASQLVGLSGIGGSSQFSQLGGMAGSIGGQALGSSIAALGSFGGPVGAIGGAIIGNLFGDVLDGLFNPNRTARALVTGPGSIDVAGKDTGNYGAATGLGGSVLDGLQQIVDALDGELGSFYTSIGVRGGDFRVNTDGTSLKKKNGAVDFNGDQEAAIRYAIADAIADGAIKGISDASQRILREGSGDLEEAIEKAVLIESIPKLLRERLDPLGAALDAIDDKFRKVADALKEGGASAEQIAEARQLWKLEREDAIAQIGEASKGLKDYLASLNAGPNSPLSLRQQKSEAEAQLAPYLDQIRDAKAARAEVDRLTASGASEADIAAAEKAARTAAGAIDQDGFQSAAQLLLGITRQTDASSGGFFAEFDRIRQLTGQAISIVDSAASRPGEGTDPFAELTAENTKATADLLADAVKVLHAINENFTFVGGGGSYAWFADQRQFAA